MNFEHNNRETAKVFVIEGEKVIEQLYPVEDFSKANGWQKCEAAYALGIPLVYKFIKASSVTETNIKELAQVLLVKPDYSILSGFEDKNKSFEWSGSAWKLDTSQQLGVLMFARTDKKDATVNLFWDLFVYIYDIIEYYRHGSKSESGIEKVKELALPEEFADYHLNTSDELREECIELYSERFPIITANTEAWW